MLIGGELGERRSEPFLRFSFLLEQEQLGRGAGRKQLPRPLFRAADLIGLGHHQRPANRLSPPCETSRMRCMITLPAFPALAPRIKV